MIEQEKKTGVKHPYLNRDLQALASLQKVILKQKAFDMLHDDPLKQKRWAKQQEDIQKKFGDLINTMTEDERNNMVQALDRFVELVEENSRL